MKLQDQVITVEQAKRLNEFGIVGDPAFYHFKAASHAGICIGDALLIQHIWAQTGCPYEREEVELIPAFTVAELGQMLPDFYPSWRFPVPGTNGYKWITTVICSPKPPGIDDIHIAHEFDRMADTQAQAMGTLLISLLETQTITPSEANTRLSK